MLMLMLMLSSGSCGSCFGGWYNVSEEESKFMVLGIISNGTMKWNISHMQTFLNYNTTANP